MLPGCSERRIVVHCGAAVSIAAPPACSAMVRYEITQRAYALALLHACKYAWLPVGGALLGTVHDVVVRIGDAVPMFHGALGLAPMQEVALTQVFAVYLHCDVYVYECMRLCVNESL